MPVPPLQVLRHTPPLHHLRVLDAEGLAILRQRNPSILHQPLDSQPPNRAQYLTALDRPLVVGALVTTTIRSSFKRTLDVKRKSEKRTNGAAFLKLLRSNFRVTVINSWRNQKRRCSEAAEENSSERLLEANIKDYTID